MDEVATGTFTGTGAAINVQLGWVPTHVVVANPNDAGALYPVLMWWKGMAAASALKITTAVAKITTLGISEYAGTEGTNKAGFTIGADADLNASGEVGYWTAYRDGQGGQR